MKFRLQTQPKIKIGGKYKIDFYKPSYSFKGYGTVESLWGENNNQYAGVRILSIDEEIGGYEVGMGISFPIRSLKELK